NSARGGNHSLIIRSKIMKEAQQPQLQPVTFHGDTIYVVEKVTVGWDTIKAIYDLAVKNLGGLV
ncbi:MAG: hypothetical protein P1P81_09265, partial [Desulfobulbales bacterium]|nr:hypothetical protein [Desulfobulbales bacterium]